MCYGRGVHLKGRKIRWGCGMESGEVYIRATVLYGWHFVRRVAYNLSHGFSSLLQVCPGLFVRLVWIHSRLVFNIPRAF